MPVLKNPCNDADEVRRTLIELGFEVVFSGYNKTRTDLVDGFGKLLKLWRTEASEIVIFYSGYGLSISE